VSIIGAGGRKGRGDFVARSLLFFSKRLVPVRPRSRAARRSLVRRVDVVVRDERRRDALFPVLGHDVAAVVDLALRRRRGAVRPRAVFASRLRVVLYTRTSGWS
jgi:hypothetical protein